ncbi:hypothetical protein, partial [Salmonella enterica]|uniref:hypothetical protein n=1 Tax=Salmonella enterica TaxID=28901 RepID=UPI001BAF57D9
ATRLPKKHTGTLPSAAFIRHVNQLMLPIAQRLLTTFEFYQKQFVRDKAGKPTELKVYFERRTYIQLQKYSPFFYMLKYCIDFK